MKMTIYAYFRFIKSTSVMLRLKLPRVLIIIFSPQTTNRTTSFRKVAPLKETTTQFCHNVSFGQTRTVKLSVGEKV